MAVHTITISDALIGACLLWAAMGERHVRYAQNSVLNGYSCRLTDSVFSIVDVSQIQCSSTCLGRTNCVTFFYSTSNGMCTGCSRRFDNTAYLVVSESTLAFRVNKKKQGDACNSIDECDGDMICFSSGCLCSPGHYYHPEIGSCTTSCSSYGNFFLDYENTYSLLGFMIIAPASHDSCKMACLQHIECCSLSYEKTTRMCLMMSNMPNNFGYSSDFVFSQRNCDVL